MNAMNTYKASEIISPFASQMAGITSNLFLIRLYINKLLIQEDYFHFWKVRLKRQREHKIQIYNFTTGVDKYFIKSKRNK